LRKASTYSTSTSGNQVVRAHDGSRTARKHRCAGALAYISIAERRGGGRRACQ
jgi:hypothetical protein